MLLNLTSEGAPSIGPVPKIGLLPTFIAFFSRYIVEKSKIEQKFSPTLSSSIFLANYRRLRPVHQDRALSSTFLSDKSIRFKRLYIQIFELRPPEFLNFWLSPPDLGILISSTMESTQSSAHRPSRLTYKEASGMAATLSMLEDIGALHAALKISAENDKDQLL